MINDRPDEITNPIASPQHDEFRERLGELERRMRECRRAARACHSAFVALSLDELADRLAAEAALIAAAADLRARIEALPS
jgi:hypothetical protein